MWKPKELIVHERVKEDPITQHILKLCQDVPVKYVNTSTANQVAANSDVLRDVENHILPRVLAAKQVMFVAPTTTSVVDTFEMADDRIKCPHFERLKLASNGCFYQCDWCYLKLTYRAAFPFITVRVQYDRIKKMLEKRLNQTNQPIIFNSGELADSLSMEHLTKAGQEFIPWFGNSRNGYLFMLTKSDNVKSILDLHHNGRTIIAWSLNNDRISRKFEIGAPTFERRLEAARKVQQAGYRVRLRLDPIVPFESWRDSYAATIKQIFEKVSPERMTIGTLRFENGFHKLRNRIFTTGPSLPALLEKMTPMFEPKTFPGKTRRSEGKYSFSEPVREEIFNFVMREIRKYSDCDIALCKESAAVWKNLGLDLSDCRCVCQLDGADMN